MSSASSTTSTQTAQFHESDDNNSESADVSSSNDTQQQQAQQQQQQQQPPRLPTHAKRWVVVWPSYLNVRKSTAQGRKVSKAIAIADPNIKEIVVVAQRLGFTVAVERKGYSRDFLDMLRVRVQLRTPDRALCHPEIRNRRALLVRLARGIAALDHRVNPPELTPAQLKQIQAQQQAALQAQKEAIALIAAKEKAAAKLNASASTASAAASSSSAPSGPGKKKKK